MKLRTLFLLVFLAAVSVFAALNWNTFTATTTLSLAFGNIQAPLGLVMLALIAFLTVLFILFVAFVQTSAFLEVHRSERDLQGMRELAEHAEASRFTKLQGTFEKETQKLADMGKESRAEVLARLNQLEKVLNSAIEQSGNSLSAYIGELEDRLQKGDREPPG